MNSRDRTTLKNVLDDVLGLTNEDWADSADEACRRYRDNDYEDGPIGALQRIEDERILAAAYVAERKAVDGGR